MIGGVLTAMVTPFDADGGLDEEASAELIRHLLAHGSDGVVLAGTTGEGADRHRRRGRGAVGPRRRDRPDGAPVIAGTGSNDTRHTSS